MQNGKIIAYGAEDFNKVKPFTKKISEIKSFVWNIIQENKPLIVGLEDTQLQSNVEVFQKLTKLLGVLENQLFENNIEFYTVEPSAWRKTCNIKGKKREEQKENAIKFVKENFGLDVDSDCADAICLTWHIYQVTLKDIT